MNYPRLGASLRALRRRKHWRQRDLGTAVAVSQSVISRLETGHMAEMTVGTIQSVAAALDAALELNLRWRGGELDRLLDERHAALVGATVTMLRRHSWQAQVEASYSHFGERGSIDVLAWHPAAKAILVVEVKSELTSIEATLRKLDEKARLAPTVATIPSPQPGSDAIQQAVRRPSVMGRILVLPATTTSRRRLFRHAPALDVALPMRGANIRDWIRRPAGTMAGILLIPEPDIRRTDAKRVPATPRRVRPKAARTIDEVAERGHH